MAHVVLRAQLGAALKLLVEPAERRALVARHERAGVQAAVAVGAMLVEHQPHEPLDAGEEHPALLEQVLVVERDLAARVLAAVHAAVTPRRRSARCCLRLSGRSRSAVGFTRLSLGSMLGGQPLANETYH